MGLVNGLKEGLFSHSISKRHPTFLYEVQERTEKYINIDKNFRLREPPLRPNLSYPTRNKEKETKKKEEYDLENPRRYYKFIITPPLQFSLVDVYREICHIKKLPPPRTIRHKKVRSRTEYYEYYKLYEHSTNDCYDLKNVIEKLPKESRLERYLAKRSDDQRKRKRDEDGGRQEHPPQTLEQHIHMIIGGFAGGGISKLSCKRYLKEVYQVGEDSKISYLSTISFTREDVQRVTPGNDDPIVITIFFTNANLHRTLVDQRSSVDILFKPAFDNLGLEEKDLKAYPDNLFGLGDTLIRSLGFISLYTTFEKGTKSRTLSIDYIVVDVMSAYNALIGRVTLNGLAAVVFIPHLCMKFFTAEGIVTIKEDQKLKRKCYNESLNLKGRPGGKEVNTIELSSVRIQEELRLQLEGKIEKVKIGDRAKK
ncbi:uncharacterized protein [Arachis hypogaea]|uniref:uncharacterized protein n=1 Tax=Arachis hypogaea TaxID=3818 RepID=UPI003B20F06D